MILQETNHSVSTIGATETSSFKMMQSRKAFTILSDLYSDKELAIVRELGCNAKDSHVVAGKGDVPFEVHIPNTLEPYFSIRDFGTGISHKDIYDVYAVYFNSTKINSNSQIGALGLGSKSPFCYTDAFTVTSITDKVKRIYSAYFNEDGFPAITLLSQTETDENNGLEVNIPSKKESFQAFKDAVKTAFRFFDVKPVITGGDLEWGNLNPIFEGNGWRMYKSSEVSQNYCIMGGVAYPFNVTQITNLHYNIADLFNRSSISVIMDFEMGELDFTPSRESLSYNDLTVENLKKKCILVSEEFKNDMQASVENSSTQYEAIQKMLTILKYYYFIPHTTFVWNGIELRNLIKISNELFGNTLPRYVSKAYTHSIRLNSWKEGNGYPFPSECDAIHILNDSGKEYPKTRIKEYAIQNIGKTIFVFNQEQMDALVSIGMDKEKFLSLEKEMPPVSRNYNYIKRDSSTFHFKVFKGWGSELKRDGRHFEDCYSKFTHYISEEDLSKSHTIGDFFFHSLSQYNVNCYIAKFLDVSIDKIAIIPKTKVHFMKQWGIPSLLEEFKNITIDYELVKKYVDSFPFQHIISNIESYDKLNLPYVNDMTKAMDYIKANTIKITDNYSIECKIANNLTDYEEYIPKIKGLTRTNIKDGIKFESLIMELIYNEWIKDGRIRHEKEAMKKLLEEYNSLLTSSKI